MPKEMEAAYRSKLRDSLIRGYEILNAGGTALDAVCAAVVEMENSELFNAAKGERREHRSLFAAVSLLFN